jgi:hypothetical protein
MVASARRAASRAARRRLLLLRRASGCLGTSHGSSRGSSSNTSPRAGSLSTTSPTPRVRVPQHVARLVVDYFDYAARPGASARRRLLCLRRASGCLRSSRGSLSTTSTTPRVQLLWHIARHVARLVAPLVVDYFASRRLVVDNFAYATRLGASTRRAARHAARRRLLHLAQAPRRLLRLRRASLCLDSSCGSWSTTSTTPRVRVPRHIAQLVAPLVVDYFAYGARPGASAHRVARHAARRRLLRLAQACRRLLRLRRASGCLGTSHDSSRGSSSTTPPCVGSSSTTSTMPHVRLLRHATRLITWLVVDYFTSAARSGSSARRAARC